MKAVKDHHPLIGSCLDTGHLIRMAQLGEMLDPAKEVLIMGKRNFGIHLKDHDNKQQTDVIYGRNGGVLDVQAVLKALREVKFAGHIVDRIRGQAERADRRRESDGPDHPRLREKTRIASTERLGMLPEEIADARQRRYNGTLAWMRKPYPDLMVFRVRPDFPVPKHRAGQYCSLGLGNWEPRVPGCQLEDLKPGDESKLVRRAYSISSSILDESAELIDRDKTDYLEFYITLVREGSDPAKPPALTPRLFMLREGDRLNIGEKITGHYTLEPVKPADTVLFLGTGTGEAPHNYMTWELLRNGHTGKILHACCVRYLKDLAYLETHHRLIAQLSQLSIPCLDDP